jgi:outer membrane protein TolC
MRRRRRLACGLACLLLPATVAAQGPESIQPVRIADVVIVLVRRSPQLALARADASIARAEEAVIVGREDWVLSGAGRYSRTNAPPTPGQPVQLLRQERQGGEVGLARVLPTGGSLNLSMNVTSQKDTNLVTAAAGGTPMEAQASATTANARLELNHPLLRGFGTDVSRAERKKAALSANAAAVRTREAATAALRSALAAYWELVYASMELETRRTSLSLAREQLEETKVLVREGVRAPGELKAAEYSAAVREEAMLASQINLESRSLALRRAAGLDLDTTDFRLWPTDRPLPQPRRYDVTAEVQRGLARNPQLVALKLQERSAAVDIGVASDSLKPRLDLQVATGVTGVAPTFDDALGAVDSGGQVDLAAAVTFSIELGRTTAHGARESARQRRRKVNIELEEARREIASSIVLSVHQIEMAGKRLEVANQSVELARSNLDAERARFRVGRASNFDVLQRQDEVDRARLARARAAADYHQAVVNLAALTGDLLENYDVIVVDQ